MRRIATFALGCTALLAAPAHAKALIDCPMRDAAFSVDSPLVDLLLSEPAKKIVESHMPNSLSKAPAFFTGTKAPTFASILTLRKLSVLFAPEAKADFSKVDADLRALQVTKADKAARCERYDDARVTFTVPKSGTRVLVFEKMTGFRDTPSVEAASAALKALATRKGWTLVATDKGGVMRPSELAKFDVVIWNNISGDVLTLKQRRAFRSYVEKGGGFLGVHGTGGDPVYFWDWYADGLLGARFVGHPMNPQFQEARIVTEPTSTGLGASLAPGWSMTDEWYSFEKSPRLNGANVVATLDEASYDPKGTGRPGMNLVMGDHPIAWTRCVGKGRSFYSAIGHRPETYSDSNYVALLEQAIGWAAGAGPAGCGGR